MTRAVFEFAPGLLLLVGGHPRSVEHLRREYWPVETRGGLPANVEVVFGPMDGPGEDPRLLEGSGARGEHKSVGWRVRLGSPNGTPLVARIELHGRPASIARSLVQGYIVEPMLSIAAARAGYVALPAAAIVTDQGPLVLMGRSRAGKSTLAARALATNRQILGDDQILVTPDGLCRAYPRRLRLYPDLVDTSPEAFGRLRSRTRASLRLRSAVASVTRGFIRPSLPVDRVALGGRWLSGASRPYRIVIIERGGSGNQLRLESVDRDRAVAVATTLLGEQRARLVKLGGDAWAGASRAALTLEARTFERLLEGLRVERLVVPAAWGAAAAVAATARSLDL